MAHPAIASTHARVAHERRTPVAMNNGTAAPTRRPHIVHPAPDGPVSNRRSCDSDRSVRKAKPNDAASTCEPTYASGHGTSSRTAASAAAQAIPTARIAALHPRERGRDHERRGHHDEEGRRDRIARRGQRHQQREAEEPAASLRLRCCTLGDVGVEPAEMHDAARHEREEDVEHQWTESPGCDRVARDGVDAVRDARRERGAAETHEPTGEAVGTDGAEGQRGNDDERAGEANRTEQDGAERAHHGEQRWRRRCGAETGVAPRGSERVEEVRVGRPGDESADSGHAAGDEVAGSHDDHDDEPEHREHVAGPRTRSDIVPTAERLRSPKERKRSSVCT